VLVRLYRAIAMRFQVAARDVPRSIPLITVAAFGCSGGQRPAVVESALVNAWRGDGVHGVAPSAPPGVMLDAKIKESLAGP
jgi:hypothetical protein